MVNVHGNIRLAQQLADDNRPGGEILCRLARTLDLLGHARLEYRHHHRLYINHYILHLLAQQIREYAHDYHSNYILFFRRPGFHYIVFL